MGGRDLRLLVLAGGGPRPVTETIATKAAREPRTMGTPQDPRTRRRQRLRRARKNLEWEMKRAQENAEAKKPKAPAKTAT